MTKIKQIICICLVLLHFSAIAQEIKIGSSQFDRYMPLIINKKIAFVGNQTSMIKNTHLVDSLLNLGVNIIKVFSPEHGFRGQVDAGEKIDNSIDFKTGIPIISLYAKDKKPNSVHLRGIDVLLFDIQDVGARFYTYISTLSYVMEAASENNIEVIVLDRPNPNGHYIDGPIREDSFASFVGMHPVPIVYGMTIGEYAKMINGEGWIKKRCKLTVIKMKNYSHEMDYNLPVNPSPNLPNAISINLYPSLCLFEGTNISVGRGTKFPFQHFGAPYLESNYSFTPKSGKGSKYPKHNQKECFGTDLRLKMLNLKEINLEWIIKSYNSCPQQEIFFNAFFDKLAGTDKLRLQIISGESAEKIKDSWEDGLTKFKEIRNKYLIY